MKRWLGVFKNRRFIVSFSYLTLIILLRWRLDWQIINWYFGGGLGWLLVFLERLVWVYWTKPQTQLATEARYLISQRRFKAVGQLLMMRSQEQIELSFHSALFQAVWVPLALFAITSTASMFGKGMIMGLGLHLLYDEWQDYRRSPELLRSWLFWQIKRTVSFQEQKVYLWIMTIAFVILSSLLV